MQSQALWSGWIHGTWGPGGFPFPVHRSQTQDDSPVSAQFPFAGLARDHAGHVFHTGRYTGARAHTLERVVETGFLTQKIGLGFKKKAGQRAVIRHRVQTGKGTCPAACLHARIPFHPSSLHFPLLILPPSTLIPLFLHPGLPVFLQINNLIT